jgi:hypothetical protein
MMSPTLHLSQGLLNLLSTCPRKFQHTYLEQLTPPIELEQQTRLDQGSRFHRLMQQWQMGLPIAPQLQSDLQLQQWFEAFLAAPEILTLEGKSQRQSEHQRTLEFQGYLFTVIYDLLLTGNQAAKILDWKTYPRPHRADRLASNWQTRLYPFVLAETSRYEPEQIALIYWFFQAKDFHTTQQTAQSLTFQYDRRQHAQTRHDLSALLQQLTHWLEQYQQGKDFPLTTTIEPCETCNFAFRCDRAFNAEANSRAIALPDFAEIQELPL